MNSQRTPTSLRAPNANVLGDLLEDGVNVRIRLSGHSMKPLLRTGSLLCFSPTSRPRVGDIILMRVANGGDDKLLAHRVLAVDDQHVWTKGDSSMTCDPPLPHTRVLGSAVALEVRGKFVIPLRNLPMRSIGLALSAIYPRLARVYRRLVPRKETRLCAS